MENNNSKKLLTLKSLIIPKLPNNFHKSLFFNEIEYQKNPTKKLRRQLINLYIQGIDYYNIHNKKDLSLYFQTKLLNIMKGGIDYFEKLIEKKFEENKNEINNYIEEETQRCIKQEKLMEDNINKIIKVHLEKQKNKFLTSLSKKRKLIKFKRINSVNLNQKTLKNSLKLKENKVKYIPFVKRVSADISLIEKEKNKDTNSIFSKIDNALSNLNKINALLIIEYTKKLKHHMKQEIQKMDETIKKYNEYIETKNEYNLIIDSVEDKNEIEAKNLQEQINLVNKEWEDFNKNNSKNDYKFNDKVELDNNNLDDLIENLNKKLEEIKLDNK